MKKSYVVASSNLLLLIPEIKKIDLLRVESCLSYNVNFSANVLRLLVRAINVLCIFVKYI
jgi:hypothetical protein